MCSALRILEGEHHISDSSWVQHGQVGPVEPVVALHRFFIKAIECGLGD